MSDEKPDFSDVEARRSAASTRRMTFGRRMTYTFGMPILRLLVFLLHASYRRAPMIGADTEKRIIADKGQAYVPCYWHQQHILCSWLMRSWIRRGFYACYIVSASVDGEVPARIASKWGADVIRGSAANTGALVLRDAQKKMGEGASIVTTSDGPLGPKYEFKAGTVLMARIGKAPLIPIACAADRAWYLDTWDNFMIPKPFARTMVAVGEPIAVPPRPSAEDLEAVRVSMQEAIETLRAECEAALNGGSH